MSSINRRTSKGDKGPKDNKSHKNKKSNTGGLRGDRKDKIVESRCPPPEEQTPMVMMQQTQLPLPQNSILVVETLNPTVQTQHSNQVVQKNTEITTTHLQNNTCSVTMVQYYQDYNMSQCGNTYSNAHMSTSNPVSTNCGTIPKQPPTQQQTRMEKKSIRVPSVSKVTSSRESNQPTSVHLLRGIKRNKDTENKGVWYEPQVLTATIARLNWDKAVDRVEIISNPEGVNYFDDIIIKLYLTDGRKFAFFTQVKYSEDKSMILSCLPKKKTPYVRDHYAIPLPDYLASFNDILGGKFNENVKKFLLEIDKEDYYFNVFTNMPFTVTKDISYEHATQDMKKCNISRSDPFQFVNVASNDSQSSKSYWKWAQNVPDGYQKFADRFCVFTEQPDEDGMYTSLQQYLPFEFDSSMLYALIKSVMRGLYVNGECVVMTKEKFFETYITTGILQILHTKPITLHINEQNTLPDATSLLFSCCEYAIKELYDKLFDWNCCVLNISMLPKVIKDKRKEDLSLKDLLCYMFLKGIIPLIVNRAIAYDILTKNQGENPRLKATLEKIFSLQDEIIIYFVKNSQPNLPHLVRLHNYRTNAQILHAVYTVIPKIVHDTAKIISHFCGK